MDTPTRSGPAAAPPTESTADHAAREASKTADEAANAAKDVAGSVKDAARDVADTATESATSLADQAAGTAEEAAASRKEAAVGVLSDVSDVLHDAGDSLRGHDRDAFAHYADQAADQIQQFKSSIRDRSVGEILDEAERFARREPGLFVGGAFLLGIFGARFLKADRDEVGPDQSSSSRDRSPAAQRKDSTPSPSASRTETGEHRPGTTGPAGGSTPTMGASPTGARLTDSNPSTL